MDEIKENLPMAETTEPVQEVKKEESKPELILGKFKSQEDLQKAYTELEKKLSSKPKEEKKEEPKEEVKEEKKPDVKPDPKVEEPKKPEDVFSEIPDEGKEFANSLRRKYGDEISPVIADVLKNGQLTEAGEAELKKLGIPKKVAERLIETEKLLLEGDAKRIQEEKTELLSHVGGEETWNKVTEWARSNLPQSRLKAIADDINTGDKEKALNAMELLFAKYRQTHPIHPSKLRIGTPAPQISGKYASFEEAAVDMRNPLYKTDDSFREAVRRKVASSGL